MNLWHDIAPGTSDEINVIVEVPRGSNNKYEVDKDSGLIKLDRVFHTAQQCPVDYGFVPRTLWDDGDALDVIILATYPFVPGVIVPVRPVAIMKMIDGGDNDNKVIAVPSGDPRWNHVKDLADINKHTLKEIEHFYSTYKILQKKEVKVGGFAGAADAKKAFDKARTAYDKKFAVKK